MSTFKANGSSSSSEPRDILPPSKQLHSSISSTSYSSEKNDPQTNDANAPRSLVPESRLSGRQRSRLDHCGHPIEYHRADGTKEKTRHRCGQTFCARCQMARTARIRACCLSSLEDAGVDTVWMVTLTVPHVRRLTKRYLYEQLERVREIRAKAMSLLRLVRSQNRGVQPRGSTHASEYAGGGDWNGTGDDFGYLWALQITPGGRVPGWHPHLHVLCTTLGGAQALRAAWLQAAESIGVDLSAQAQDISAATPAAEEQVARYATRATEYVGGQVASLELAATMRAEKSAQADEVDVDWEEDYGPKVLDAYLEATRNLRRYDAGGCLRPLGVGARERVCTTCGAEASCGPRRCFHEWCDGRMRRKNPVVAIASQANPDIRVEPSTAFKTSALLELGDVRRGLVVGKYGACDFTERPWLYPTEKDRVRTARDAAYALAASHNAWWRNYVNYARAGVSNQIEQTAQFDRTPLVSANDVLLDQLEVANRALEPPGE